MCEVGRELGLTLKWPRDREVVEWEEGALELTAIDGSPLLAASFLCMAQPWGKWLESYRFDPYMDSLFHTEQKPATSFLSAPVANSWELKWGV